MVIKTEYSSANFKLLTEWSLCKRWNGDIN